MATLPDSQRITLIGGPYRPPKCSVGDWLACEVAGEEYRVGGLTDAPIPWPRRRKNGKASLIVCGDLAKAVRIESVLAICHYWGVNYVTVWRWRKALGVPQINKGTGRLYKKYKPLKLTKQRAARGRRRAAEPDVVARMAETKRGKPAHPRTKQALLANAKKPKSKAWRERMSLLHQSRGTRPINTKQRSWTAEEDAALGTDRDRAIAERLKRSIPAVRLRRRVLGIAAYQG